MPTKKTTTTTKRKLPKGMKPFEAGSSWTKELAAKGGRTSAAQRRAKTKAKAPFAGSILDCLDASGMSDPSWAPWKSFWRATFGLPVTGNHLVRFRQHTNRQSPPTRPVSEAWAICGRRAGKSYNAAVLALYKGITFDPARHGLAPQEYAALPIISKDRRQSQVIFRYLRGLAARPIFAPYIHRILKHSVELTTGCNIEVHTCHYGAVRGYTVVSVVCDEVAFWQVEGSNNPDEEVIDSLRPAMLADALLFGISSPYAQRGVLHEVYQRSFGHDDPEVLCWNSDTLSMHPTYAQRWRIDRMFSEDPAKAASEFGHNGAVEFRKDVQSLLDVESVAAVTVTDRRELPPVLNGTKYVGFVDPSGGSQDSFTLAVCHREGEDRAVLDLIRERRPPFSPDSVVQEFAEVLASYGITTVVGDRYAGEWPRESFRTYGITYEPSSKTKSDIYRELVAPTNSGRIELLDVPVLRTQLLSLERRVARGGRDSIDHAPGGRDDLANAAAGALVNALPASAKARKKALFSFGPAYF
jgi:hypothetical protein